MMAWILASVADISRNVCKTKKNLKLLEKLKLIKQSKYSEEEA